ncbi:hypothetical protein [Ideonella sp.]|jgi:hypothetical protein|uniref:hypothetical protein n=1 Tax=Ideonella sp. TaxID=1929293 RepID=UPI0037BF8914
MNRTLISLSLCSALLAASGTTQAATPIENWLIVEGRGLGDDFVYLGMSRQKAMEVSGGLCANGAHGCIFRPREDAGWITLVFCDYPSPYACGPKKKVKRIEIRQTGSPIQWRTTAGAADGMTVEEVQALYPGHTSWGTGGSGWVTNANGGYTYQITVQVWPTPVYFSTHVIQAPKR